MFETYVAATIGANNLGSLLDFLRDTYSNNPNFGNGLAFYSFLLGIRVFPLENLGFETSAAFGELDGQTSAFDYRKWWSQSDTPLLNSLVLKLGLGGRLFLLKSKSVGLSISLSGGVNYGIVSMTDALKNQIAPTKPTGYTVNGIDNAFGVYAKAGLQLYIAGLVYFGLFNEISYQANRRANTGENLDGVYGPLLWFEVEVYSY